jgi:hypothetical protein
MRKALADTIIQTNRAARTVAELDGVWDWEDGIPSTLALIDALARAGLCLQLDNLGVAPRTFAKLVKPGPTAAA